MNCIYLDIKINEKSQQLTDSLIKEQVEKST
jgi:hypothetical protein